MGHGSSEPSFRSEKDRAVLAMVLATKREGRLRPGMTIVDCRRRHMLPTFTTGNPGPTFVASATLGGGVKGKLASLLVGDDLDTSSECGGFGQYGAGPGA